MISFPILANQAAADLIESHFWTIASKRYKSIKKSANELGIMAPRIISNHKIKMTMMPDNVARRILQVQ